MLLDNWRMLHGRKGFEVSAEAAALDDGGEAAAAARRLWRVWCWTEDTAGLPADMPEIATPLDVEALRS